MVPRELASLLPRHLRQGCRLWGGVRADLQAVHHGTQGGRTKHPCVQDPLAPVWDRLARGLDGLHLPHSLAGWGK